MATFWEPTRGVVVSGSAVGMALSGTQFRIDGNTGTGGPLSSFQTAYGGSTNDCVEYDEMSIRQFVTGRHWWLRSDDAVTYTAVATGRESLVLPRRQVMRFTVRGLECEQVDLLHPDRPFAIHILKVKNTNLTTKTVDAFCAVDGNANCIAHRSGDHFYGSGGWAGSVFVKASGESAWTNDRSVFIGAGTLSAPALTLPSTDVTAPVTPSAVSKSSASIAAGESATFVVLVGGSAIYSGDALFSGWANAIDGEAVAISEVARMNEFYDQIVSNTSSHPVIDSFLQSATQFCEEQIHVTPQGRHITLHGGWAEPGRMGPLPYTGGRIWQSYPYHFVLIQAGRADVVRDELLYYLEQQLVSGCMNGFNPISTGEAGVQGAGEPYTSMMYILSVHQYMKWSRDLAFANEVVNGKTVMQRLRDAAAWSATQLNNGSMGGMDWHDAWPSQAGENSQGTMVWKMVNDVMAEMESVVGTPAFAEAYETESARTSAWVMTRFATQDAGHKFFIRRIDPLWSTAEQTAVGKWATNCMDDTFWAHEAGITNDVGYLDSAWGKMYYGQWGVGMYCGNGTTNPAPLSYRNLTNSAWCEKFFEFAKADAKLGNTRAITAFIAAGTAKMRYCETALGGWEFVRSPTYSANGEFYRWVVEGIFGAEVDFATGKTTFNKAGVPTTWSDSSLVVRVGDEYITSEPTKYALASAYLSGAEVASGSQNVGITQTGDVGKANRIDGSQNVPVGQVGSVILRTDTNYALASEYLVSVPTASGSQGVGVGQLGDVIPFTDYALAAEFVLAHKLGDQGIVIGQSGAVVAVKYPTRVLVDVPSTTIVLTGDIPTSALLAEITIGSMEV